MNWKLLSLSLAVAVAITSHAAEKALHTTPNIIFILADDLGVGEVGSYGYNDIIQTPNLDKMALEGTRFTHAYSGSPVCAPSRCVLMTGKHTGHARRRDNGTKDGSKTLVPLLPEDVTIAEMLKQNGYVTGGCGKWGLGNEGTTGTPDKQGFDHFYGYLDQRKAHNYYVKTLWSDGAQKPVELVDGKPRYSHDSMADDMLDWIDQNHEKPFFYYAAFCIPHDKYQVPDLGIYKDMEGLSETEKIFAAMITRLDADVGRLFELLKERGIDENTIVFFTSDNGPSKIWGKDKFNSAGDQRGKKRDLLQGGVNAPMIVRWPGKVPANKVSDFKWVFYDVMPTLAEIAGAQAPDGGDGRSVLPTLLGEKQTPHEFIYWEFYTEFQQALIMGDYKAIRYGTKDPIQLYKLSDDRREETDIASSYPEMVDTMAKIMDREHVDDPYWPTIEHGKKSAKEMKRKSGK